MLTRKKKKWQDYIAASSPLEPNPPPQEKRSMPQYTTYSGITQTYRIGEGLKVKKTVE